jgi:hypothetical protein
MLTLEPKAPVAGRRRNTADFGGDRVDRSASGIGVPMAYELLVADAVCHLLTTFFTIEQRSPELQVDHRIAETLEWASNQICTALQSLDQCSNAFWLMEQSRNRARCSVRRLRHVFGDRRRERRDRQARVIDPDRPLPRPGAGCAQGSTVRAISMMPDLRRLDWAHRNSASSPNVSGADQPLSSSIVQMVGAYRALDELSRTRFPWAAPLSFERACRCLCAALARMDECSRTCER